MVLVSLILGSILMGLFLLNWASVQRRGSMKMGVAIQENLLCQSAIQETRLRMFQGTFGPCVRNVPQSNEFFTMDGSTVTVQLDCNPYP